MGIFTRLFHRGQDGDPSDPSSEAVGDEPVGDEPVDGEPSDTEPVAREVLAMPTAPEHDPLQPPPTLPTGTGPTVADAAPAPIVEPGRSIWDPPPQRTRRERERAAAPALPRLTPAHGVPSSVSREPTKPREMPKPLAAKPRENARSRDNARPQPAGPPHGPPQPGKPRPARLPSARPHAGHPEVAAGEPARPRGPARPEPAAVIAAEKPAKDRNDATMVVSPPPAPTSTAAAAPPRSTNGANGANGAHVAPPGTAPAGRRTKADSIGDAVDQLIAASAAEAIGDGVMTAKDREQVRGVFNDIAAVHVAQVRDVMLELHYGDASASWIEATQPALRSLRAMASQLELSELCTALDEFCGSVEAAVGNGSQIGEPDKAQLIQTYQRLIELIPQAFDLDSERDRREPIIVEALLYQVDGVEKPTIDKLFSVGLARLDALLHANPDELAVVSGIRIELASAIVAKLRAYREAAATAVAASDPAAERKQLAELLRQLNALNDEYAAAAAQWTDAARAKKREARKQREQVFQRIKVSLARLGERDQLVVLEKLPFVERIAQLDRYLTAQPHGRP